MNKAQISESIIILDTNILLELYRKSADMTKFILDSLAAINFRLWIPYQVWEEFEKHEQSVKKEQYNKYKNIPKSINEHLESAKARIYNKIEDYENLNFPNVGILKEKFSKYFNEMDTCMRNYVLEQSVNDELCKEIFNQNIIRNFVNEFKSHKRIGERFNTKEYLEVIKEGELRYKYKIPPGYMDDPQHNKDSKKQGVDIFGDLFLWKQTLKYAKEQQQNVILVTEDSKEDWYINGIPRKELIEEFNNVTGRNIKICRLNDFIDKITVLYNLDKEDTYNSLLTIRAEDYFYELDKVGFINSISTQILSKLQNYDYEMLGMKSKIVDIEFEDCEDIDLLGANVHFDKEAKSAKYTYELIAKVEGRGVDTDYYNMPIIFKEVLQLYITFTREMRLENDKVDLSNKSVNFNDLIADIMFANFIDYDFDDSCVIDERY